MRWPLRLALSIGAAIAVSFVVVLALAIADLYWTGHGHGSLNREVIAWSSAGIHLGLSDIVLLVSGCAAAGTTWRLLGRAA